MVPFFMMLTIAIVAFYWSRTIVDEATQLVVLIVSRFCLFLSLIYAPWPIKLLIFVVILTIAPCTQQYRLQYFRCSQLCTIRASCSRIQTEISSSGLPSKLS